MATVNGLQTGKVIQIHDDPDGEFRVLLKITGRKRSLWAPLTAMYATAQSGSFFYPEIDDEVIIGFLNDDSNHPVILGSLYSSRKPPAFTPEEENNTKAIVTRNQMKLVFNEEEQSITISTPGGNQLLLTDDDQGVTISDQNSNFIKMSSAGIEINSASTIKINAASDCEVDALNITNSANANFTASGSAGAELTSSASTSIKGALVMIN